MAREDTQFKQGNPGGPGRPKGGRTICIESLDAMLAKSENVERFKQELQSKFDADPLQFWKEFAVPILPKNIEISGPDQGPLEIDMSKLTDKQLEQLIKLTEKAQSDPDQTA